MILISLLLKHSPNMHDIKLFKFIPFSILFFTMALFAMFMKNHHEMGALLYNEWKQISEQKKNKKNERKVFRPKSLLGGLRKIKKNQQKLGASCRMNKTLLDL